MIQAYARQIPAAWIFVLAGVATLAGPGVSRGVTTSAVSAPVGLTTVSCLGSSDTIVSTPLDRPPVYIGSGTPSTSGGVTTIAFGNGSFAASQFKHVSGSQPNTYFARIGSGTKAGCFYPITDNGTASITVNLNGDSLAGVTSAVSVLIIPYWTLNTVFPSGAGVTPSSGFTAGTQILLPDTSDLGTNLAATSVYYYSGSAAQWFNAATSAGANDVILPPDFFYTVRNRGTAATTCTICGNVATTSLVDTLNTSTSGQQDNPIALDRPVPVTLNNSGLISSGAFTASSGFKVGDQLLVFDNTVVGFNKSATAVYTYVNGVWEKSGAPADSGTDAVFTPGTGVIIRKAASATGATAFWTNPAGY